MRPDRDQIEHQKQTNYKIIIIEKEELYKWERELRLSMRRSQIITSLLQKQQDETTQSDYRREMIISSKHEINTKLTQSKGCCDTTGAGVR